MKKLLVVAALMLGALAFAGGSYRMRSYTHNLTQANPTVAEFEANGFPLSDVAGFRVGICVPDGQTFVDGGTIGFWLNDGVNTYKDTMLTHTFDIGTGNQCIVTPDFATTVPAHLMLVRPFGFASTAQVANPDGGAALTVVYAGDAGTITTKIFGFTDVRR